MVSPDMRSETKEHHIGCIEDYIRILNSFADKPQVYYRGQRQNWTLLPGIARIKPRSSILQAERLMFDEFRKKATRFIDNPPDSVLDWLAIAQHYGLPTRLLDWTRDPFKGLWFTIRKPPDRGSGPGVLWIFTPEPQDIIDDLARKRPFQGSRTKVFVPSTDLLDRRIKAQEGAFTVHKFIDGRKSFVPLEKQRRYKTRLKRILVDSSRFADLRRNLRNRGIEEASMFPDLDGLARSISYSYCKALDEL